MSAVRARAEREPKMLTAVSVSTAAPQTIASPRSRDWRLHKHADYQRVYQASRKHFAPLVTWFVAPQPAEQASTAPHIGPRIGITAGKVLGKAVERNRIKRRMRAAITANLDALSANVDVVLHPKRAVLTAPWTDLGNEVRRIFVKIQEAQIAPERKVGPQRSGELSHERGCE